MAHSLLAYYNGSVFKALQGVYSGTPQTSHHLTLSKNKCGNHGYSNPLQRCCGRNPKQDWLANYLQFTTQEDLYKIQAEDINSTGGDFTFMLFYKPLLRKVHFETLLWTFYIHCVVISLSRV
jgi:hypothetical protein